MCIPAFIFYAWALFGSWEKFVEGVVYLLTPDAWSFVRGEGVDDTWATMKFGLLLVLCIATVYEAYVNFIPWVAPSFAEYLTTL